MTVWQWRVVMALVRVVLSMIQLNPGAKVRYDDLILLTEAAEVRES